MIHRDRKLLDLAHEQDCVNCQSYGCDPAHSNEGALGKGGAQKAHDCMHAHLCRRCHAWYDAGRGKDPTGVWQDTEKQEFGRVMILRTHIRLWSLKLVRVA